jgi:hypothetical protein
MKKKRMAAPLHQAGAAIFSWIFFFIEDRSNGPYTRNKVKGETRLLISYYDLVILKFDRYFSHFAQCFHQAVQ